VCRRWLVPRKRFHAWFDGEQQPATPTPARGFVDKTPEGRYRAYFRDPAGKQRFKTFRVKKDATAFLAEMETTKTRGTYVSPHAGRLLFGENARRWMATWNTEATTAARDRSILNTHVLPRWGDEPLGKIDDMGLQEWGTGLGQRRSRATVAEALRLTGAVLRSAVRNRLIRSNPADEVRIPRARQHDTGERIIPGRSPDGATAGRTRAAPGPSSPPPAGRDCAGVRRPGSGRMRSTSAPRGCR
jgi:hypothetical protein